MNTAKDKRAKELGSWCLALRPLSSPALCLYLGVFALLCGPSAAAAAPPNLTYLYPAGAQRGTTVEVTAGGTFERWPVGGWADRRGVVVKAGKARGTLTVTVAADALPGVCWIRLHDEQGASELRPFLIGTVPEVREREPNDDPARPHVLDKLPVVVNGRLEKPGDVDVFAVELRKGQTLVASLEANRTLKSPMDGVLQVVSPAGFVLEQNDDHLGMDPQVIFTAPSNGRYLVRTFAFPASPDASVRFAGAETFVYRLTLTTGGFADYAWPLAVPRARPGEVAVVGWNIPEAARKLPVTVLPGSDLGLVFHPQLANVVPVRLEPHATAVATGPNRGEKPKRVAVPVTVTGRLVRPGAVDVYEFALRKGQTLPVLMEARPLDSPLDPVLRLTDGTGKLLKEARAARLGADPELTVTATADATYRIEVRDLHGEGGSRFVYRLRLAPALPDFALAVKGDRFALKPGTTLDIPVTVERRAGFKGDIEVAAVDLPQGITAQPVRAAAGGTSVTLRLKGEGTLAAGAFRIVGRAKGEPERAARAPATAVGVSTEHLWITLSKTATVAKPGPKKKR
jgi:hypothetical protein